MDVHDTIWVAEQLENTGVGVLQDIARDIRNLYDLITQPLIPHEHFEELHTTITRYE